MEAEGDSNSNEPILINDQASSTGTIEVGEVSDATVDLTFDSPEIDREARNVTREFIRRTTTDPANAVVDDFENSFTQFIG